MFFAARNQCVCVLLKLSASSAEAQQDALSRQLVTGLFKVTTSRVINVIWAITSGHNGIQFVIVSLRLSVLILCHYGHQIL